MKKVMSNKGDISVEVPNSWKRRNDLHEEASLEVANLREEAYLIVLQESKNDFVYGTTLSDYRNIIIPGVLSRIGPNPTSSEPELISVDGNPAIAYTLSGAIDNIKVTYYIVLTENNNDFFQVFTWSLTSRFKQNEQTLRDVAQTFTSQ